MRNVTAFGETDGHVDRSVEGFPVLSDTLIADANFDAQPVLLDTSTRDVPR
jgi:hypothetical protein